MNKQKRGSVALTSWVQAMQQLGEYVVGFQELEATMNSCISALVSRDKHVGQVLTAQMSFRSKLDVLVSLLLYRLGTTRLPASLADVIKEIGDCEQRRNTLVHSLWDIHLKDPEFVKRVKVRCSRRSGLARSEELVLPDDLYDEARSFENIAERLSEEIEEHLPKVAGRM